MWTVLIIAICVTLPPEWEAALNEILEGRQPCNRLFIRYQDGNGSLGRTIVRVRGGYARVIRHGADGLTPVAHSGRIGHRGCVRLVRQILRYPFRRPSQRRRIAHSDETRPEILIRIDNGLRIRERRFGFDVQNDPAFAVLRGEMIRIARQLSAGTVRW